MSTRLCLVVETTTRYKDQWRDIRLNIVEPILRVLDTGSRCELALVLMGVPGLSIEEVLSSQWATDTQELRQWMDGIEFCGGGAGAGLTLAPALLAAACLFDQPTSLPSSSNHCLLCMVSDPGAQAVCWPHPQDCGKITGCSTLATASELCCAFQKHGIHLGLATRLIKSALIRPCLLWHLLNIVAESPLEAVESTSSVMEAAKTCPQLQECNVVTRGQSIAFLPFWDKALHLLQTNCGNAGMGSDGQPRAVKSSPAGSTRGPAEAVAPPAPAAAPPAASAPAASPALADASPGGFWDVMNSELITGPSDPLSSGSVPTPVPGLAMAVAMAAASPPAFQDLSGSLAAPAHVSSPLPPVPPSPPLSLPVPAPVAAVPAQAPTASPVMIWRGPLRLSDRVRGAGPSHICNLDAYVAAESAPRAKLAVDAMVVEAFLPAAEARRLAGVLTRPGALVMRLVPRDFGPQGENGLRRMADGQATGQLDLGTRQLGYLSVMVKESGAGEQHMLLRLVVVPR